MISIINIAICDDEPAILDSMFKQISEYMNNTGADFSIDTFNSAELMLYNNKCDGLYDIVFLDIKMSGMNGLDTAKQIRKTNNKCFIIFVTAIKEFVFDAFDVNASNYLIKPVDMGKLTYTLDKIMCEYDERENKFITLQKSQAIYNIKISDITYCELIRRKIFIHTSSDCYDFYSNMDEISKKLCPHKRFFKCHRSFIINLSYLKDYKDDTAILTDGTSIPVSRLRKQEFTQAILSHMSSRV